MLKNIAEKYYSPEYDLNCAETLLYAANEAYNLNLPKDALKTMAGFGGGMVIEDVCGALTGAIAALGVLYVEDKAHESEILKTLVPDLIQKFEEKLGTKNCKLLKDKYREDEPIKCKKIVLIAALALEEVVNKMGLKGMEN